MSTQPSGNASTSGTLADLPAGAKNGRRPGWFDRAMLGAENQPALCLTALSFLLVVQISPWWIPTRDACSYLSIARSFVAGHGLANLGSSSLWYSPGYSLLISPAFFWDERPFLLLSILQCILALGFMGGVYVWARRVVPQVPVTITALSVGNVQTWSMIHRTLSEIAFMCALFWTANLLHAVAGARTARATLLRTTGAVLLMALVCLIRPAGMALAAGFAAAMFLAACRGSTNWTRAAGVSLPVVLASVITVGGFVTYEKTMAQRTGSETYMDLLDPASKATYLDGLGLCISDIGRVTVPGMFKSYGAHGDWLDINMLIFVALFAVLMLGWWRFTLRQNEAMAWMLPFFIALHTLWSTDSGARFFIPMIPLVMISLWFALDRWGDRRQGVLGLVLLGHLGVACGYWLSTEIPRARALDRQWPMIESLATPIQSDPGLVVNTAMPLKPRLMLQLTLDRHVIDAEAGKPVDHRAAWLITRIDGTVPQGFAEREQVGDYLLLRRVGKPVGNVGGSQAVRR